MQSWPTGVTLHDFLCGVAPVGQLGMEGISAFYTGNRSLTDVAILLYCENKSNDACPPITRINDLI